MRRAAEQNVRGSLYEATKDVPPPVLQLVERRHELVVRVERHLGHAGVEPARLVDVQPSLRREDDEGRLGRVADDLAVANRCVVRKRHREQERAEWRVRLATDSSDHALGGVPLAVDRVAPADDHELPHGHLVERERAGLVGADGRRRAERLDRAQALYDRPLGGKCLGSEREDGGDDRGEPGRDRGDREADPDQEELVEVVAVDEAEDDDERQRRSRHHRQQHGELVELPREWGLLLPDLAQHAGDLADLGRHAGRRNDHLTPSAGHGRVHVGHVYPVAERSLVVGHGIDRLQDGHALAGEGRLLDLQRGRDEQTTIRRDLVTGLEEHDVTGNELLGRDFGHNTPAADVGPDHEHPLQRRDALRRLAFLIQAENRVGHRQAEDDEPGAELLKGDDADDRGAHEDELHQVAVLAHERVPTGLLVPLGEPVGAVRLAPPVDLVRVEPASEVDVELRAGFLHGHPMPRQAPARGVGAHCQLRHVHDLRTAAPTRGQGGVDVDTPPPRS